MTNYQAEVLCYQIKDLRFIPGESGRFTFDKSNRFEYKRGKNYLTIFKDNTLEGKGEYGHYSRTQPVPKNLEKQIMEILNTDYMESDIKPQVGAMEEEIEEGESIYHKTEFDNLKKTITKEIKKLKNKIIKIQE